MLIGGASRDSEVKAWDWQDLIVDVKARLTIGVVDDLSISRDSSQVRDLLRRHWIDRRDATRLCPWIEVRRARIAQWWKVTRDDTTSSSDTHTRWTTVLFEQPLSLAPLH